MVVFWSFVESVNDLGQPVKIPFLRHYTVFNTEQVDGLPEMKQVAQESREHSPIEECEAIIAGCPFREIIRHDGGNQNYYRPSSDTIHMVKPENFTSPEAYYGTLFHEMIHATGHVSRLDRGLNQVAAFGSPDYSREELVAEIGSAFLCEFTGISTPKLAQNQAAYVAGWLKILKEDNKAVVWAAGRSQKAVDSILNLKEAEESEES
jgi:antirestriction protein ArdC